MQAAGQTERKEPILILSLANTVNLAGYHSLFYNGEREVIKLHIINIFVKD